MNTTPNHNLQIIGENIRKYRRKKEWSQEDLAFETALHRTYIGGIERGERNLTVLNLIIIAKKLEMTLDDLYPMT